MGEYVLDFRSEEPFKPRKNIQHWTRLDQDFKYQKVNVAVLKMVMLMLKMRIMVEMTLTATLYDGDAVVYVEDDC